VFRKVRGNQQKPEPIKAPTPAPQQPAATQTPSAPSAPTPPASTTPTPPSSPAPQAAPTTPAAPRQTAPAPSGRNVLSSDVEITGSIKFSNDLVVDGKIDGKILSDGSLTVGENARIKAEIKTHSVVIYGKVYGNIEVTHTVELKANCELVGDIKAASLSIEPGAIFVGKSTVGKPTAQPQATTKKPEASKPTQPQQPVKVQQSGTTNKPQQATANNKPAQSAGKPAQAPKKK